MSRKITSKTGRSVLEMAGWNEGTRSIDRAGEFAGPACHTNITALFYWLLIGLFSNNRSAKLLLLFELHRVGRFPDAVHFFAGNQKFHIAFLQKDIEIPVIGNQGKGSPRTGSSI